MENEFYFCDWCEKYCDSINRVTSDTHMCDDCYTGAHVCQCGDEYMHDDIGIVDDGQHTEDGGYCCASCCEKNAVQEERGAQWLIARQLFIDEAVELGYDAHEIAELLDNNRDHGAYMQKHGRCSETIVDALIDDVLCFENEDVESLISAMGGASARHEDTDYDQMRADGISRENAREYANL